MSDVTRLLDAAAAGDPAAANDLLPLVYDELRRLAAARMVGEPAGQTLQPTALVHEAYLRLVASPERERGDRAHWNGRGHFFGAAAEAMRRILVDRARRKQAEIHGGARGRVDLQKVEAVGDLPPDRLLALDEALTRLAHHDPVAGQLVHLRYFAGLSVEAAAEAVGLSRATAYRHWTFARAWLVAQLTADGSDAG
jgi:RNA polymerase sigma factor (TIGR02999 family)